MSGRVVYRDSDRSANYSTDDYVPLSDYNHSFRNAIQTSQLRMVIAPGTVKNFNSQFTMKSVNRIKKQVYATEVKAAPITSYGDDDGFGYASYPTRK
jgi:hypothetical protein